MCVGERLPVALVYAKNRFSFSSVWLWLKYNLQYVHCRVYCMLLFEKHHFTYICGCS